MPARSAARRNPSRTASSPASPITWKPACRPAARAGHDVVPDLLGGQIGVPAGGGGVGVGRPERRRARPDRAVGVEVAGQARDGDAEAGPDLASLRLGGHQLPPVRRRPRAAARRRPGRRGRSGPRGPPRGRCAGRTSRARTRCPAAAAARRAVRWASAAGRRGERLAGRRAGGVLRVPLDPAVLAPPCVLPRAGDCGEGAGDRPRSGSPPAPGRPPRRPTRGPARRRSAAGPRRAGARPSRGRAPAGRAPLLAARSTASRISRHASGPSRRSMPPSASPVSVTCTWASTKAGVTSAPSQLDDLVGRVGVRAGRLVGADPRDGVAVREQGGRERVGRAVDGSAAVQGPHDVAVSRRPARVPAESRLSPVSDAQAVLEQRPDAGGDAQHVEREVGVPGRRTRCR